MNYQYLTIALAVILAVVLIRHGQVVKQRNELDTECEYLCDALAGESNEYSPTVDDGISLSGATGGGSAIMDEELKQLLTRRDKIRTDYFKQHIKNEIRDNELDLGRRILERSYPGYGNGK